MQWNIERTCGSIAGWSEEAAQSRVTMRGDLQHLLHLCDGYDCLGDDDYGIDDDDDDDDDDDYDDDDVVD